MSIFAFRSKDGEMPNKTPSLSELGISREERLADIMVRLIEIHDQDIANYDGYTKQLRIIAGERERLMQLARSLIEQEDDEDRS